MLSVCVFRDAFPLWKNLRRVVLKRSKPLTKPRRPKVDDTAMWDRTWCSPFTRLLIATEPVSTSADGPLLAGDLLPRQSVLEGPIDRMSLPSGCY